MNATPLRVLIVDDEAPARDRLRTLLSDIAPELPNVVVGEAADGVAALEALQSADADLALVDVRMPRMDGLEFAQHLSTLPAPPAIVFTTAYDHYAVQAFEVSAVDYLLKPIRAQRLRQAIDKAVAKRRPVDLAGGASAAPALTPNLNPDARRFLSCHERGKLLLVAVVEVIYFRADTKYVTARTPEREYLLSDSLLTLESEFPDRFIRLHRSVLVAKDALAGFEKSHDAEGEQWTALLKGIPDRLPISRRHWPAVKGFAKQLAGE
jgi:two-component system, LytTR family, response regulator AlgR